MISTYLNIDLSEALGLDSMPEADKKALLDNLEQTVTERILSRAFLMLDEDQKKALDEATEDNIFQLLNEYIPTFDIFAMEQIAEFKKEVVEMAAMADKIIAEKS